MNPISVLRNLVRSFYGLANNVAALRVQLQDAMDLRPLQAGSGAVIDGSEIAPAPGGEATPFAVSGLAKIPYPVVDLSLVVNPIPLIAEAPEFTQTDHFFDASPAIKRSLVSVRTQALLYALIRNLCPEHVFEIGTDRAGTSEAICRALHGNGKGTLHTVDPQTARIVTDVLSRWPQELRRHVRFYALDSMGFFAKMAKWPEVRPQLVFVDGNHDYEYALFDILSAARVLAPGGFIAIDNILQAGPYLAARDFLATRSGWTECSWTKYRYDHALPFDTNRRGIPDTELMVLRAPLAPVIGDCPVGFPEIVVTRAAHGIEIKPGRDVGAGVLNAQCVARGFSSEKTVEEVKASTLTIGPDQGGQRLQIALPIDLDPDSFEQVRAEIWLSWNGERPLPLLDRPTLY